MNDQEWTILLIYWQIGQGNDFPWWKFCKIEELEVEQFKF